MLFFFHQKALIACMICDYYHVFMIPVSPILASGRTTGLIILYVNSSARLKTHNIIFLHAFFTCFYAFSVLKVPTSALTI